LRRPGSAQDDRVLAWKASPGAFPMWWRAVSRQAAAGYAPVRVLTGGFYQQNKCVVGPLQLQKRDRLLFPASIGPGPCYIGADHPRIRNFNLNIGLRPMFPQPFFGERTPPKLGFYVHPTLLGAPAINAPDPGRPPRIRIAPGPPPLLPTTGPGANPRPAVIVPRLLNHASVLVGECT